MTLSKETNAALRNALKMFVAETGINQVTLSYAPPTIEGVLGRPKLKGSDDYKIARPKQSYSGDFVRFGGHLHDLDR